MKDFKNYNATYDRHLTSILGDFLAYCCSTSDTIEEQKKLADIRLKIIKNSFYKSIGL